MGLKCIFYGQAKLPGEPEEHHHEFFLRMLIEDKRDRHFCPVLIMYGDVTLGEWY